MMCGADSKQQSSSLHMNAMLFFFVVLFEEELLKLNAGFGRNLLPLPFLIFVGGATVG